MREITQDIFKRDFLTGKNVKIYLQPIVHINSNSVVGYEALSRGNWQGETVGAELLFEIAEKFGLIEEFEFTCLKKALTIIPDIPGGWVSVNLGANLLMSSHLLSEINQIPENLTNRLVFELTEHMPVNLSNELFYSVSSLREKGIRISLDDVGCGFISFDLARILKPNFIKLCIIFMKEEFFTGMGYNVHKRLKNIVNELTRLGITTIAEGVENEKQIQFLHLLDVEYAQGFYFSHPIPAEEISGKKPD